MRSSRLAHGRDTRILRMTTVAVVGSRNRCRVGNAGSQGAGGRFALGSPGMGRDNAPHTRAPGRMLPSIASQYSIARSSMRSAARMAVSPASETQPEGRRQPGSRRHRRWHAAQQ
jgi:hypothetical protein